MLSDKVTHTIENLEIILNKINSGNDLTNKLNAFQWNLDQIVYTAENTNILFRLASHSITMLRHKIINPELVDIDTFKTILKEGLKTFPNLEFPIRNITRYNFNKVLKLIDIQDLGESNFVALIPLVNKTPYKAFNLIPLPVNIGLDNLMIAKTKDMVLTNGEGYIITDSTKLEEIEKGQYLIKETLPVWTEKSSSCELEVYKRNVNMVLKTCNFVKLDITDGMYVTSHTPNRILYLTRRTKVELNCPDGRIKSDLVGLHTVPDKCDITTDLVSWQAEQSKRIEIEQILQEIPRIYDITKLPIMELNSTSEIHESIKELIDKLPKNDTLSKLTIDDWSLEEIQSYSVLTHGITISVMVLHSIIIVILMIITCKRSDKIPKITSKESYSRFKKKLKQKLREDMFDSARSSFRRGRDRFRDARDSIRTIKKFGGKTDKKEIGINTEDITINLDDSERKRTRIFRQ